jgi:hypothetical protein
MHSHKYRREINDAALERLISDLRTLSPAGIERVAWGWDRHEKDGLEAYHAAEKAALTAIESSGLGPDWDTFRHSLFTLTEGRRALVSWKVEHGDTGHKAERAAFGAALGLFTQGRLKHDHYAALVGPMAEALPWLLPEVPPQPYHA